MAEYNQYGLVAVRAYEYMKKGLTPEQAWYKASCEQFLPHSPESQKKGCPRNAFLGLFLKNVNSKNATYARNALDILRRNRNKNYSKKELWSLVVDESNKTHNSQMDVVLALWNKKLIR